MIRGAILSLLLFGTLAGDQIRIDHREGTTGNFAPVHLTTLPGYVITFDAGGNPMIGAMSGGPGGVSDGDKGDVTVSASGATWTVDAGAISLAKMASLAQSKLIGRWTASTGVPEAITVGADFLLTAGTLSLAVAPQPADADLTYLAGFTPTANVKSLLNAADYSAMRTQLSLVPGTDVQAYDADLATIAAHTTAALGATTALAANTTYTGAITTRTVTLPAAASSSNQVIRYAGTAAASTVITWPASAVRQVGASGYATSTTFAIGNAEFSLWSDGTDWFLADSTGTTGTTPVTSGGTGVASLTAYAPIFGGTTSTGAVQSGSVGTSGQVLTSGGPGVLPTFQTPSTSVISDPFIATPAHATIGSGPFGFVMSTGSSGTLLGTNGRAGAPGWLVLSDGSNAAGYAGPITQTAAFSFGTSGTYTLEWRFETPAAASDGTNGYTIRAGFIDSGTGTEPTDGCYLRYNASSANFRYVTRSASVETNTDSTLAFAASTIYLLRIVVTTTGATFTINGGSSSGEITTNFPTGTNRTGIGLTLAATLGTNATTMQVDKCELTQ